MLYNWIFSLQSAVHFSLSEMQRARYVHNLPRHLVNALRVIPAVTDAAILEYYRVGREMYPIAVQKSLSIFFYRIYRGMCYRV